jgi:LPS-assembly lipoprotein
MSWFRAPWLLPLLLPVLLSACGFSLRGTGNIPPEISVVYIESPDRFSDFYRALVDEIRASRLTLAADSGSADTVIRVSQDQTGQRTLSVSGRNVPTEYEIWYTVQYSLFVDGEEVLPPTRHTRVRDYTYDETLVLGKALEEEGLRKAIASDLVGLVVQHLAAVN